MIIAVVVFAVLFVGLMGMGGRSWLRSKSPIVVRIDETELPTKEPMTSEPEKWATRPKSDK